MAAHRVELRRNGQVCGTFGPYADRAAALTDAAALRGPGLETAVVPDKKPRRNGARKPAGTRKAAPKTAPKARRNNAAVAAAIGPLVTQLAQSLAKTRAAAYLAATPEQRVAMLRRAVRFNIPVRLLLRNDARAAEVAAVLADFLESQRGAG
jgi:hypothetical protein